MSWFCNRNGLCETLPCPAPASQKQVHSLRTQGTRKREMCHRFFMIGSLLPASSASKWVDTGPETELAISQPPSGPDPSWLWGYFTGQAEAGPPLTASVSPSVLERLST